MNTMSDQVDQLIPALVKVQRSELSAFKDGHNSHRKYGYATINSFLDSVRGILAENEIVLSQVIQQGSPDPMLVTLLIHASGQWIRSEMPLVGAHKQGAQDIGSMITYMRRYSIAAILGVTTNEEQDDDGAKAQEKHEHEKNRANQTIDAKEAKLLQERFEKLDANFQQYLLKELSKDHGKTITSLYEVNLETKEKVAHAIARRESVIKVR